MNWNIIEFFINNHGYETQVQRRYKKGDKCMITKLKNENIRYEVGDIVTIIESARYDYLIGGKKGNDIVYQFEIEKIKETK